jgi:hypothetical protein
VLMRSYMGGLVEMAKAGWAKLRSRPIESS